MKRNRAEYHEVIWITLRNDVTRNDGASFTVRTQLRTEIQAVVLVVILTGSKKETWRYSIRSLASLKKKPRKITHLYLLRFCSPKREPSYHSLVFLLLKAECSHSYPTCLQTPCRPQWYY